MTDEKPGVGGLHFAPVLTSSQWISLPHSVRLELVRLFGIPRSGGAQVVDGKVKSDGYTNKDLERINVVAMQIFLDSDEPDFFKLFNKILEGIEEQLTERNRPAPPPPPPMEVKITLDTSGTGTPPAVEVINNTKADTNAPQPNKRRPRQHANRKASGSESGEQGTGSGTEKGDGAEA